MGVLSTRSLLGALGISSRRTGEASAAINWVVKDGVGKLSRLLFARWCALVSNPDTEQSHTVTHILRQAVTRSATQCRW